MTIREEIQKTEEKILSPAASLSGIAGDGRFRRRSVPSGRLISGTGIEFFTVRRSAG